MIPKTLQFFFSITLMIVFFASCNDAAKFPENLSKVKKGMSPTEVEQLIGKPERIENLDLGSIDFKRWIYNPGNVAVDFSSGKVEKIVTEKDRFKPGESFFKQDSLTIKVDPTLSAHPQDLRIIYDDKDSCTATCKAVLMDKVLRISIEDKMSKSHRLQNFEIEINLLANNKAKANYSYTDSMAKLNPANAVGFSPNLDISVSSNSYAKGTEISGYLRTVNAITNNEGGFVNARGYFKCKIE